MSKLLYIKASPRGEASRSAALADVYLEAPRAKPPDLAADILDLARERGACGHGRRRSAGQDRSFPGPPRQSSACSRSAMRSAASSSPTDSRNNPSPAQSR